MSANHRERHANLATRSIIVASLDLIKSGIRPIQLLGIVINGETIGRLDLCCDDIMHLVAREVGCLNACLSVVPVGPIHSPVTKVIIIYLFIIILVLYCDIYIYIHIYMHIYIYIKFYISSISGSSIFIYLFIQQF